MHAREPALRPALRPPGSETTGVCAPRQPLPGLTCPQSFGVIPHWVTSFSAPPPTSLLVAVLRQGTGVGCRPGSETGFLVPALPSKLCVTWRGTAQPLWAAVSSPVDDLRGGAHSGVAVRVPIGVARGAGRRAGCGCPTLRPRLSQLLPSFLATPCLSLPGIHALRRGRPPHPRKEMNVRRPLFLILRSHQHTRPSVPEKHFWRPWGPHHPQGQVPSLTEEGELGHPEKGQLLLHCPARVLRPAPQGGRVSGIPGMRRRRAPIIWAPII